MEGMESKSLLAGESGRVDDYSSLGSHADVSDTKPTKTISAEGGSAIAEEEEGRPIVPPLSTQDEADIFAQNGQEEHATFKAAIFNLANATIGSGVLGRLMIIPILTQHATRATTPHTNARYVNF